MTDKRGSLPSTMNKQEPVWSTTDNRKSVFFFKSAMERTQLVQYAMGQKQESVLSMMNTRKFVQALTDKKESLLSRDRQVGVSLICNEFVCNG